MSDKAYRSQWLQPAIEGGGMLIFAVTAILMPIAAFGSKTIGGSILFGVMGLYSGLFVVGWWKNRNLGL